MYYAESWKKGGSHQIRERTVKFRLDRYDSSYETVITDASGSKQYTLIVEPIYFEWDGFGHLKMDTKPPNGGNPSINLWDIRLLEPDEKVSLLMANRDQGDVIDINNTLASLSPLEDTNGLNVGIFGVPILSRRVIKVEAFYCVIKVDSYQLSAAKERAFEWISVEIEFANTKPDLAGRR